MVKPSKRRAVMKVLTHVAVAAMVAMTAVPTDAGAQSIGEIGFVPNRAVTFNGGAEVNITAAITTKSIQARYSTSLARVFSPVPVP